ncbi:MAG: hypothetical protein RLZZ127_599 [Planctomycetota bacterium]|jgi:hypothetical protein
MPRPSAVPAALPADRIVATLLRSAGRIIGSILLALGWESVSATCPAAEIGPRHEDAVMESLITDRDLPLRELAYSPMTSHASTRARITERVLRSDSGRLALHLSSLVRRGSGTAAVAAGRVSWRLSLHLDHQEVLFVHGAAGELSVQHRPEWITLRVLPGPATGPAAIAAVARSDGMPIEPYLLLEMAAHGGTISEGRVLMSWDDQGAHILQTGDRGAYEDVLERFAIASVVVASTDFLDATQSVQARNEPVAELLAAAKALDGRRRSLPRDGLDLSAIGRVFELPISTTSPSCAALDVNIHDRIKLRGVGLLTDPAHGPGHPERCIRVSEYYDPGEGVMYQFPLMYDRDGVLKFASKPYASNTVPDVSR